MPTYWSGNKKVSKATYDSNTKKAESFTGPKIVNTSTLRQPSGKQPDPALPDPVVTRANLDAVMNGIAGLTADSDPFPHLNQGSPYANTSTQPDTSALNAIDQDTLRRLQEAADRKRMEEQFEAAASHGKEIVFEFSKPISSKANTYVSKLVKMLGGKRSYIEDQTKLVVVM